MLSEDRGHLPQATGSMGGRVSRTRSTDQPIRHCRPAVPRGASLRLGSGRDPWFPAYLQDTASVRSLRAIAAIREAGACVALDDYAGERTDDPILVAIRPGRVALESLVKANIGRSTVIAEGVEQPTDFDMVQHLGIKFAQGYLFGRPVCYQRRSARLARS